MTTVWAQQNLIPEFGTCVFPLPPLPQPCRWDVGRWECGLCSISSLFLPCKLSLCPFTTVCTDLFSKANFPARGFVQAFSNLIKSSLQWCLWVMWFWGSAAPCKINLKLWRRDFSLPTPFHGPGQGQALDLDPPLQARCWGCACGGGSGELGEEGELQLALVLLFQALLSPERDTDRLQSFQSAFGKVIQGCYWD